MHPQDIPALVCRLMPGWQPGDIHRIDFLSGGYSNHNFAFNHREQRYVLRLPRANQPFVDRVHEGAWYARLPPDLSVTPLYLDSHTGVMLTPWVEGPLLIDIAASLTLTELADYLRGLHRALPDPDRFYDVAAICNSLVPEKKLPAGLNTTQRRHSPCHNDLNPWNIIQTPHGWVTLDWEFVGLNNPLFDVVSLHQGLGLSPDSLAELASLYLGPGCVVDQGELDDIFRAFWTREWAWAEYQLNLGNDRTEIRQQQITARNALGV